MKLKQEVEKENKALNEEIFKLKESSTSVEQVCYSNIYGRFKHLIYILVQLMGMKKHLNIGKIFVPKTYLQLIWYGNS